jgi:hypothetical protein
VETDTNLTRVDNSATGGEEYKDEGDGTATIRENAIIGFY